jgi:hypothetical protein
MMIPILSLSLSSLPINNQSSQCSMQELQLLVRGVPVDDDDDDDSYEHVCLVDYTIPGLHYWLLLPP